MGIFITGKNTLQITMTRGNVHILYLRTSPAQLRHETGKHFPADKAKEAFSLPQE
jgi:hypothetical protein